MRPSASGFLALLIALPAGIVTGAAPATAAPLTVSSVAGFVADDVHQRVFVGDRDSGTILAADYSGKLVDSASGISDISDLALSADSQVLYAASWRTHEIVALDPATLDEVTRYTAATTYGPRHLAFAGGKVWFSYGDQWDGNLGSVAPDTGAVTMNQYPGRVWGQALLDGAAARPGVLVVAETGLSTSSMAILDVSGASPVETAFHNGDYSLNKGIQDIDLIPGATQVLVNGRERQAYAGGTFSASGAYTRGTRADISDSGFVSTAEGDEVNVFRPNVSRPINTVAAKDAVATAWSADESRLFVLKGDGPYTLSLIDAPTVTTPKLTVSAPASAPRAKPLTVRGTYSTDVPFSAIVSLHVVRKDLEHPEGTALPDAEVGPDGTWSIRDTPTSGGPVTYVVSHPGDANHQAVTSSATVSVARATPTLSVRPGTTTHAFGTKVTFTARLGSTYKSRKVELWADPAGDDKPRTRVKSGVVGANGTLSWSTTLRRNTTVFAVYAGDSRTAPRTVSSTANTRVSISVGVSRHYKVASMDGHRYHWFHKKAAPVVKTSMSPFAGRSVRMDIQALVDGTWTSIGHEFFRLNSAGRVGVDVGTPNQVKFKARVRSSYIRGSSGDSVNTTTHGAWTYLYWTK